jgi:hypothetical protein
LRAWPTIDRPDELPPDAEVCLCGDLFNANILANSFTKEKAEHYFRHKALGAGSVLLSQRFEMNGSQTFFRYSNHDRLLLDEILFI